MGWGLGSSFWGGEFEDTTSCFRPRRRVPVGERETGREQKEEKQREREQERERERERERDRDREKDRDRDIVIETASEVVS